MLSWVRDRANVVQSDLQEFARVVQADTSSLLSEKKQREERACEREKAGDRCAAIPSGVLTAFQENPDTYLVPLDAADPEVVAWQRQNPISEAECESVLKQYTAVRRKHDSIVPAELSGSDFWLRYFYRLDTVRREEERRALLQAIQTSGPDTTDWGGWGEEDGGEADAAVQQQQQPEQAMSDVDTIAMLREENEALKQRIRDLAAVVQKVDALEDQVEQLQQENAALRGVIAGTPEVSPP